MLSSYALAKTTTFDILSQIVGWHQARQLSNP